MHQYAQTNIQLFNQVAEAGYEILALATLRTGHDLAARLFAGICRPNGKPFICHLVGTASILAAEKRPIDEVAAGILHAAYSHRHLRGARGPVAPAERQTVAQAIGQSAEALVFAYTNWRWNEQVIRECAVRLPGLDPEYRTLLRLRLANELEDQLDRGLLYGGKRKPRHRSSESRDDLVQMARALGCEGLAGALAEATEMTATGEVPVVLRRADHQSYNLDRPD